MSPWEVRHAVKHQVERSSNNPITIDRLAFQQDIDLSGYQVVFVNLPELSADERRAPSNPASIVAGVAGRIAAATRGLSLPETVKVVLVGEPQAILATHPFLDERLTFHRWFALMREGPVTDGVLPNRHAAAVIYSTERRLLHNKVRLPFSICPACGNTTKDYGAKKHIRGNNFGTLMSDVWRDVAVPRVGMDVETEARLMSLLATPEVERVAIIDATDPAKLPASLSTAEVSTALPPQQIAPKSTRDAIDPSKSIIVTGDCLDLLPRLPDESVDLVFLDPPYNLEKDYASYSDDRAVEDYFEWCDTWIEQCVRVLRPGGSLVIINIPLWSIRHALYLNQRLTFQNWIAWDALSQPKGYIMPAHYPLIWYSKGPEPTFHSSPPSSSTERGLLVARQEGLCLRQACIKRRAGQYAGLPLTDLWTDIFRVLHNGRRLDHPCILPVELMQRIVAMLSDEGSVVLDPY